MITEISKRISHFLYNNDIVSEDEMEIYQYGFEVIVSTLLGFIITVTIGIVFQMILLSIFYYFIFVMLRQFTGGYHADTYLKCNLIFANSTIFIFAMSKIASETDLYKFSYHLVMLVFSIIVIWIKAPVENENKQLSEKQKKRNHVFSIVTATVLSALSLFLYKEELLTASLIAFTLFIISFMILVCSCNRKEVGQYE